MYPYYHVRGPEPIQLQGSPQPMPRIFGGPFLGGVVGGLLGGSLISLLWQPRPPYIYGPRPLPPPVPYYGYPPYYGGYGGNYGGYS